MIPYVKRECAAELALLDRKLLEVVTPFPRYTTHELEEKHGSDWEAAVSFASRQPVWVLCHKREFYDKEDPTKPGHYLNYDLIYPEGFGEALSGAEREHDYKVITSKMERHGLDKSRYGPYLEFAEKGLVPSAGAGFGVERLVRWLAGAEHVKDVQLFERVPGERVVV